MVVIFEVLQYRLKFSSMQQVSMRIGVLNILFNKPLNRFSPPLRAQQLIPLLCRDNGRDMFVFGNRFNFIDRQIGKLKTLFPS